MAGGREAARAAVSRAARLDGLATKVEVTREIAVVMVVGAKEAAVRARVVAALVAAGTAAVAGERARAVVAKARAVVARVRAVAARVRAVAARVKAVVAKARVVVLVVARVVVVVVARVVGQGWGDHVPRFMREAAAAALSGGEHGEEPPMQGRGNRPRRGGWHRVGCGRREGGGSGGGVA